MKVKMTMDDGVVVVIEVLLFCGLAEQPVAHTNIQSSQWETLSYGKETMPLYDRVQFERSFYVDRHFPEVQWCVVVVRRTDGRWCSRQ